VFQLTYCYEARKPGVKDQITEMAFNGAGVRDTARTLKIGMNTVIRTLKTLATKNNVIPGRSCGCGTHLRT
jgi:transposase-like protein